MKNILLSLFMLLALVSCNEVRDKESNNNSSNQAFQVIIKDKTIQELKDEKAKLTVELQAVSNLIKQKELERVTFWSKLVGGIALGLATLCLVASFFLLSYPVIPFLLRTSSYILAGVGFLAFTVSYIYPYLIPIGFGTLFVILVVTGFAWYRDRKGLVAVTQGVNELKTHIPHYRDVLKKHIKNADDKWVDKVRKSVL